MRKDIAEFPSKLTLKATNDIIVAEKFLEVLKMEKREARIIRPAKKSTEEEKQKIMTWLDEMQEWAKSVGLTEQDVEDAIREVRQERQQALQAQRQSA